MGLTDTIILFGTLAVAALIWIATCLKRLNDNLVGIGELLRFINNNLAARVDLAAGQDVNSVRERMHYVSGGES